MKKIEMSITTVLLALLQVSMLSLLFALPIRFLWYHTFTIFLVPFLPTSVTYFSLVGIIFISLTIFKIIRTTFK